jgi:ABC-2 type transport system permease protein
MNVQVSFAVFCRNFVSYFASPLGYLFICLFVLVGGISAFWPNEFFTTNLANLDQLNATFPLIMLFFIPAITMGVWADERKQGTDELLLTIPASDLDVVVGKYLATVAIYTVALGFSLLCNYIVLATLGDPDGGLFLGTYAGYWLIGMAMLSVGMAASFLTANLTVAYVLGVVFNVPLVFLANADVIFGRRWAPGIAQWSLVDQFRDFGRGIFSFGGMIYFVALAAVLFYLSMVLIGRRHWVRGRYMSWSTVFGFGLAIATCFTAAAVGLVLASRAARPAVPVWIISSLGVAALLAIVLAWCVTAVNRGVSLLPVHFAARFLALVALAASAAFLCHRHDVRLDMTSEKLSTLSPQTLKLLSEIKPQRPVHIEAFISPSVPEMYVQTRLDLISRLEEIRARGKNVTVRINPTSRYTENASLAEKRYNITARRVPVTSHGRMEDDNIYLGVAFTCGMEKVILPFIDRGIPAEYELVRSLATVTQQKRKKIGILQTDAQLYGQFNFQSMASSGNWPIVDELEKQYEVTQVDAGKPITERYDVLFAVQPSSLGPEQMEHFIAAVRGGQPTAIFEDPFPVFASDVPATSMPRRPPGGMQAMMMQQQQMPKGDIRPLWDMLGVEFFPNEVIWQSYNPFPKLARLPKEFVFVDKGCGAEEAFSDSDPISSKLQHILFPYPGSIAQRRTSPLKFTPLVTTGRESGTVEVSDLMPMNPFGGGELNPNPRRRLGSISYVLAARIQGKLKPTAMMADEKDEKSADAAPADAKSAAGSSTINVVLVADIDMFHPLFSRLREQGDVPQAGIFFDFDNISFVLNTLDSLAGDNRFLELRKRRAQHRTLTRIDAATEKARKETDRAIADARAELEKTRDEEQKRLDESMAKLQKDYQSQNLGEIEAANRVGMALRDGQQRMKAKNEQAERTANEQIERIETKLNLEVQRVQNNYKFWAVVLPPLPLLGLALAVFFIRRANEHEGVSKSRLRS